LLLAHCIQLIFVFVFPSFLLEQPAGKLDFYFFQVDCLTVVAGSFHLNKVNQIFIVLQG